jgi:hypothetical protein
MPETVSWSYNVRAVSGPALANSGTLDVDAYQKLNVPVTAGATQDVTVAPGTWADVLSLVITASSLNGDVQIMPDGAAAAFPLDGPLLLFGGGAVSLLGTGDATVSIANTGATDVTVDIFVTRDATPP